MSDIRLFKEMLKKDIRKTYWGDSLHSLLPVDVVADIMLFPGLVDDAAVAALETKKSARASKI